MATDPLASAVPLPRDISQRTLVRAVSDMRTRIQGRFYGVLTDQVSAFISGGMDRERHLGWAWLHRAGYIELWQRTNYGRTPKE